MPLFVHAHRGITTPQLAFSPLALYVFLPCH